MKWILEIDIDGDAFGVEGENNPYDPPWQMAKYEVHRILTELADLPTLPLGTVKDANGNTCGLCKLEGVE